MVKVINISSLSFNWDNYNGKLKIFQKSQIINIMDDYYNSDLSVSKIISKYSINMNIRNLSEEFPLIFLNEQCPYDGSHLLKRLPSRSGNLTITPQCDVCGHRLEVNCSCDGCENQRKILEKRKREIIISTYTSSVDRIEYENLSATSRIFLSVLLHAGLNDEATKISGEKIIENKLSLTHELDCAILEHLLSENVILVDPMSPMESFNVNNFPNEYYIFKVNYLINLEFNEKGLDFLEYPDRKEIIKYKEECLDIWKQIALHECIEYLINQMKIVNFDFNPKEKTKLVISHLLEEYSIGQVRNLIYGSVNNAATWYQRSGISKKHAANSAITTLNNRGSKAKVENWNLKPYQRNYGSKASQLSIVFFNDILQKGDRGYEEVPSIKMIEEL